MDDETENVVELRPKKPASAARRAAGLKGLAAAKARNHRPAGGEGQGERKGTAPAFSASYQPGKSSRDYDPAELAEIMRDRLLHLAMHGKGERTQLGATAELLDRLEGKSIARTVTDNQAIPLPGAIRGVRPRIVDAG